MTYRSHVPRPPLSDFVSQIWLWDGYVQPHAKERVLPDGSVALIVNLREDALRIYDRDDNDRFERYSGCLLSGPRSEHIVIDTASQASILGVHFKPGGAFPFFGVSTRELKDASVSLDALWGPWAAAMRERLLEAATPETRFAVVEEALRARAGRPLVRHPAVAFALRELRVAPHARSISDVTAEIGMSPRRFIELFGDEVGLTPKLFFRVSRFQAVLRRTALGRRVEWADVAASCGYFDQAHFIRDFRAFSGLNPSAYLARRSEHLNHVPILD